MQDIDIAAKLQFSLEISFSFRNNESVRPAAAVTFWHSARLQFFSAACLCSQLKVFLFIFAIVFSAVRKVQV